AGDPVVVAAGDISTRTKVGGNKLTSDLILSINPSYVLALGDDQYPNGALVDYQKYFTATWGRFKGKIRPAPGNHEYYTDFSAAGYYSYFGGAASPQEPACTANCKGYYSYDVGNWHIVALNTNDNNCQYVGCQAGSAQITWLQADLATNTKPCIAAYFHHPRWSSGTHHGSNAAMGTIWSTLYSAGTDVVLNGHEHNYERFAKQDPAGAARSDGIREFVVGTGGNGLYGFGTPKANSQVRNGNSKGVLKLTLHANSYDWQFQPAAGYTFTDSGNDTCN
ncbi:MAG: metallophosphoesterase, partial [Actinomycetota bacterium]|nr:metallophosphoesterase [Actinomycetota bacterium]